MLTASAAEVDMQHPHLRDDQPRVNHPRVPYAHLTDNHNQLISPLASMPYPQVGNHTITPVISVPHPHLRDNHPRVPTLIGIAPYGSPSACLQAAPALQTCDKQVHVGSIGHPEMCPKPCLFFQAGHCKRMFSCTFCHLPHPNRTSHLDKRNRELLRNLQDGRDLQILLEALRSRAQLLPFRSAANKFVDALEPKCCHLMPREGSEILLGQKNHQRLTSSLKGHVFSSLLSLFTKIASEVDPSLVIALEELRSQFEKDILHMEHPTVQYEPASLSYAGHV